MSSAPPPEDEPGLTRLDPDRAAREAGDTSGAPPATGAAAPAASRAAAPRPYDTRRYQWGLGAVAILLVIAFTVYRLTSGGGPSSAGVAAGLPLHDFAAPLAGSTLVGDANLRPPCSAAHHDPRALNTCLLVSRAPLVLAFLVPGAAPCERTVDAMQALAPRFAGRGVSFAAVLVHTGPGTAAAVLRRHRWRLPVAYDRDGAVGEAYGVVVCPLVELVRRGGTVAARLIGRRWDTPQALLPEVDRLAGS